MRAPVRAAVTVFIVAAVMLLGMSILRRFRSCKSQLTRPSHPDIDESSGDQRLQRLSRFTDKIPSTESVLKRLDYPAVERDQLPPDSECYITSPSPDKVF